MAKIDEIKEEISYLKFWVGVFVAVAISLLSYIVKHFNVNHFNLYLLFATIALVMDGFAILFVHKKITKKIKSLKDL
jgi:hypothetical protein